MKTLYKDYYRFFNSYYKLDVFDGSLRTKNKLFDDGMNILTNFHYKNNKMYNEIIKKLNFEENKNYKKDDLPYLPVTIFKNFDMYTADLKTINTIATSSGTSSSKVSKIFLDRNNSINQLRVLTKILTSYFGTKKLPMLVLANKINNKSHEINAKLAAIKGFSVLASELIFCLDEQNNLDQKIFKKFIDLPYKNKLIFGFTYDIWQKLYLSNLKYKKIDLSNTTIIHGGGWKKLENIKVDNLLFKKKLYNKFKIKKIINYYGMIEQTGSIFLECYKCNNFFPSIFSDILIRNKNLDIISNEPGLIQLMSLLPTSYPGHNILTEDVGEIVSDNCKYCNSKNIKQFRIYGRIKNSDIRGCSNI